MNINYKKDIKNFSPAIRSLIDDAVNSDLEFRWKTEEDENHKSFYLVKVNKKTKAVIKGVWVFPNQKGGFGEAIRIDVEPEVATLIKTIKDIRKILKL